MESHADATGSIGLSYYLAVLRRQWVVVVGGIVAGVVAAVGVLLFAPHTVTATTAVNLNVITTEPFNQQRPASGLLDAQTEADIASSHLVAQEAAKALDNQFTAAQVRAASQVSTAGGATVVRVAFTAPTQALAVRGADAVAAAYLTVRTNQAEKRIDTMLTALNARVKALNTELLAANKILIGADPNSTELAQAASQVQQIQVELDGLLSQRNALSSVDTTGGIILTSAQDSYPVQSPARTMTLATGLAAGLILGILAAYVWNARDRRLRSNREIANVLGAPELTSLEPLRGATIDPDEVDERVRVVCERLRSTGAASGVVLLYDARHSDVPSQSPNALRSILFDEAEIASVTSDTRLSDVLAALREADSVVVLCTPRTARIDDLVHLRTEAETAGTPVVGFIAEP